MTVTDPVCGMKIEAEDAVATAEHGGDTYYFCSQECKAEFEENPEDYT
jgi:YHS domain-containing protein